MKPFEVRTENVAPPEKVGGNMIGGLIPYLFIILCFTGAMYPAMDLTAGEKERGTMETILCSPVARTDLVLGKFLVVLTASLTAALISMISMGLTFVVGGILMGAAVPPIIERANLLGIEIKTLADLRDQPDQPLYIGAARRALG